MVQQFNIALPFLFFFFFESFRIPLGIKITFQTDFQIHFGENFVFQTFLNNFSSPQTTLTFFAGETKMFFV